MQYVLYTVTVLYAALSLVAAIAQIRSAAKKDTPALMLCGSLILAFAVILQAVSGAFGWIPALIGGLLISLAAYLNGRRSGAFHISHHIIRAALTVLLVAGFLIV